MVRFSAALRGCACAVGLALAGCGAATSSGQSQPGDVDAEIQRQAAENAKKYPEKKVDKQAVSSAGIGD